MKCFWQCLGEAKILTSFKRFDLATAFIRGFVELEDAVVDGVAPRLQHDAAKNHVSGCLSDSQVGSAAHCSDCTAEQCAAMDCRAAARLPRLREVRGAAWRGSGSCRLASLGATQCAEVQ